MDAKWRLNKQLEHGSEVDGKSLGYRYALESVEERDRARWEKAES